MGMLGVLALALLALLVLPQGLSDPDYIHIGIAVDDNSLKDFLIVMQSALITSKSPSTLTFHIVACGKDANLAVELMKQIEQALVKCLPHSNYQIKPFTLPETSGFYSQLNNVKKRSHWYSPSGADMVRFFLASLFPDIPRILYIDNDVIINCCLEEVWHTDLGPDAIVGIALDDLKWATSTQFKRQYNASHPLVISNIRRSFPLPSDSNFQNELQEDEFMKALPKYPNDGVLLIDIQRYNNKKILDCADNIARANGNGDYVVGLGTQQFTVLCMHDRWVELTPRANLRHFPDMARGYLMWFYYTGFLHYAGVSKPRAMCQWGDPGNEHRASSYTAWATAVKYLTDKCPNYELLHTDKCASHIPVCNTFSDYIHVVEQISKKFYDSGNIILRFGAPTKVSSSVKFPVIMPIDNNEVIPKEYILDSAKHNQVQGLFHTHNGHHGRHHHYHGYHAHARDGHSSLVGYSDNTRYQLDPSINELSYLSILDHFTLLNTSWNIEIIEKKTSEKLPSISRTALAAKRSSSNYVIYNEIPDLCDGTQVVPITDVTKGKSNGKDVDKYNSKLTITAWNTTVPNTNPIYPTHCKSVLDHIKKKKIGHWAVVGIIIDYKLASLEMLRYIDFDFIRPKFIFIRLMKVRHSAGSIDDLAHVAIEILVRAGFMVVTETNTDKCKNKLQSEYDYACVWGTRVNAFELLD